MNYAFKMMAVVFLTINIFLCFTIVNLQPSFSSTLDIKTPARQAIIYDHEADQVLFEKNADQLMQPASMAKVMTAYIVFDRIKDKSLNMSDTFLVSDKAWRMGGSRSFLELNNNVTIKDLLLGLIVQSGNDAAVVLAEGISGDEEAFAREMNRYAKTLGMRDTYFTNSTGWPHPDLQTTARDLAVLTKKIIQDFPILYKLFEEKIFTYNKIKQSNRNPLLHNMNGADGLKTGHTNKSGYGLIGSVKRNERRVTLVINGLNTKKKRTLESKRLFNIVFKKQSQNASMASKKNKDIYMLKAKGNSWVEIEDELGNIIISKLMQPGDEYTIPKDKVLYLNTGNAGALSLQSSKEKISSLGGVGEVFVGKLLNFSTFKNNKNKNLKIVESPQWLLKLSDKVLCDRATFGGHWFYSKNPKGYINEAKRRGLDCGVNDRDNKTVIASKPKPKTKTYIQPKSSVSSAELDAANKRARELERKLAALENKQKQEQQRIKSDNQEPIINAFTKLKDSNAIISGRVTDNTEVAEVLIDGQTQQVSSNGTFETKFYIPRTGKTIEIVAFDTKGNKASKLLKIERGSIAQASGPIFDTLNPSGKRVKSNPNALALIIGVADYEKTNADALYADKDAQQFYDYATMKLGVSSSKIKELINDKADESEILLSVKEWLRRSAKPNKSDIYVFFAGHGLASQDGKNMYLLPHDGSPRLLDDTAILRDRLFADLKATNPKSVTVFLDTCYSGVTRNEEMLIAGRPIVIKAKEQAIPDGFTLFSAASNEQISRPLEEAKHGMFSYFLMKGMEGDADSNNDNKITARELHAYVEQNVVQQSSGSQTPELQGDKDRVLVQFN